MQLSTTTPKKQPVCLSSLPHEILIHIVSLLAERDEEFRDKVPYHLDPAQDDNQSTTQAPYWKWQPLRAPNLVARIGRDRNRNDNLISLALTCRIMQELTHPHLFACRTMAGVPAVADFVLSLVEKYPEYQRNVRDLVIHDGMLPRNAVPWSPEVRLSSKVCDYVTSGALVLPNVTSIEIVNTRQSISSFKEVCAFAFQLMPHLPGLRQVILTGMDDITMTWGSHHIPLLPTVKSLRVHNSTLGNLDESMRPLFESMPNLDTLVIDHPLLHVTPTQTLFDDYLAEQVSTLVTNSDMSPHCFAKFNNLKHLKVRLSTLVKPEWGNQPWEVDPNFFDMLSNTLESVQLIDDLSGYLAACKSMYNGYTEHVDEDEARACGERHLANFKTLLDHLLDDSVTSRFTSLHTLDITDVNYRYFSCHPDSLPQAAELARAAKTKLAQRGVELQSYDFGKLIGIEPRNWATTPPTAAAFETTTDKAAPSVSTDNNDDDDDDDENNNEALSSYHEVDNGNWVPLDQGPALVYSDPAAEAAQNPPNTPAQPAPVTVADAASTDADRLDYETTVIRMLQQAERLEESVTAGQPPVRWSCMRSSYHVVMHDGSTQFMEWVQVMHGSAAAAEPEQDEAAGLVDTPMDLSTL